MVACQYIGDVTVDDFFCMVFLILKIEWFALIFLIYLISKVWWNLYYLNGFYAGGFSIKYIVSSVGL